MRRWQSAARYSVDFWLLLALWAGLGSVSQLAAFAQAEPELLTVTTLQSARPIAEVRAEFAGKIAGHLLQKGIPAWVSVEGEDNTVIRIEWAELNGPKVYEIVTSPLLRRSARRVGVKTVIFSDGGAGRDCQDLTKEQCEQRWDYDVERESMIWQPSLLEEE